MTKRWGPNLKSDLTKTKRRQAKQDRRKADEALAEYQRDGGFTLEQVKAEIESADQPKH